MNKDFFKDRLDTAARIRQVRERVRLTQEQFAEILGISLSGYKKVENAENQISLTSLRKLHQKFQVSSDYILFGTNADPGALWEQIMNCPDSEKMLLMLKLVCYFAKSKDSLFYQTDEQENIDQAILHAINEIKKYKKE